MKRLPLLIAMISTGCAVLILFLLWFLYFRFIESTKDAYVNGNQVVVTSQITGFVEKVYCQDTQLVKEGDLLIALDQADQVIALTVAKEALADAIRQYLSLQEKLASLEAEKQIQTARFIRTAKDYLHRIKLIKTGAIAKEDCEHAEADFVAAFAATTRAQHDLLSTEALLANTTLKTYPNVVKAQEEVKQAFLNHKRCKIYAPATGMVAKKNVQVGESISPHDALLTIVPFDQMWVDANFKEVQLPNVRAGLPAEVRADLYGRKVLFHGKILGISAGTGSVFSVLPPQNATGNWIKIVQRLPVRIGLDPAEIQKFPLRLGLSMKVTIDIRAELEEIDDRAQFVTHSFLNQQEGMEEFVAKIFEENSP